MPNYNTHLCEHVCRVPLEVHVWVLLQQVQRMQQQQPSPWQQRRVLGFGLAALRIQVLLSQVDAAELPAV
jgi:hypothetical protein